MQWTEVLQLIFSGGVLVALITEMLLKKSIKNAEKEASNSAKPEDGTRDDRTER